MFEISVNVHLALICRVYICNLIFRILHESSHLGLCVNESRWAGRKLTQCPDLFGVSTGPQVVREDARVKIGTESPGAE